MNQSTNRNAKNAKNFAIPNHVKQENDLKVTRNNEELWQTIGECVITPENQR